MGTLHATTRRFSEIAVILAMGMIVGHATSSLGNSAEPTVDGASAPTCKMGSANCPKIDPRTASGCTAEAAAYASALVSLAAAEEAADEAYDDWYTCENSRPIGPRSYDVSRTPSILINH